MNFKTEAKMKKKTAMITFFGQTFSNSDISNNSNNNKWAI